MITIIITSHSLFIIEWLELVACVLKTILQISHTNTVSEAEQTILNNKAC